MVSIIVPVYKVEKYLNRCVGSILSQTYKNLEVILVDDGSPDNSGVICDEYAQKDGRIKVIHKQNGGLSSARNAGLEIATGKYVSFVDSDDWLDCKFIETLIDVMVKTESDMSACSFCRTKGDFAKRNKFEQNPKIVKDKYFAIFDENSYAGYACNKLFKREIIEKYNLRFDEKIFNGEDFPFALEYVHNSQKTSYINQDLYFYFFREMSIMNSIRLSERFISIIYAREKALDFLRTNAPKCYDVCKASYLSILLKIKYMSALNIEKYNALYLDVNEKINKNKKGLFRLNKVGLKNKIKLFFMINFPKTATKMYKKKVRVED